MGGNQKGGRIGIPKEVETLIAHQIKTGGLTEGQTAYVKLGGDGTQITKKETCTAHTITLSNNQRALQLGDISIVMGNENYQVGYQIAIPFESFCMSTCVWAAHVRARVRACA